MNPRSSRDLAVSGRARGGLAAERRVLAGSSVASRQTASAILPGRPDEVARARLASSPRVLPSTLLAVILLGTITACTAPSARRYAPVDERRVGVPPAEPASPPPPATPLLEPVRRPPPAVSARLPPPAETAPPSPARRSAPRSASPAVVALLDAARVDAAAGRYERAAATLERGLEIEPANPWLWNRLARIRLRQGRLAQAETLAIRSNSLAGNRPALRAENRRLIAAARARRG